LSSTATDQRWEAFSALLAVIALQLLLALLSETRGWKLWTLPWWIWLLLIGPELALLAVLRLHPEPRDLVSLAAVMGAVNAFALTTLIGSVVGSHEHSGGQLLLKGVTVWATNVCAFGIVFWQLAHYGRKRQHRQFHFPQQDNPNTSWKPSYFDFLYVSFTNSIAFSPTDAMPLTHRAKLLMLLESAVSAIAILLVAARAVNIFK
jgi:uncharacterized membrane protein